MTATCLRDCHGIISLRESFLILNKKRNATKRHQTQHKETKHAPFCQSIVILCLYVGVEPGLY